MEKRTLTSAVVAASLIGTPALAEDKLAQPQLKPSANAVEFCDQLRNAPQVRTSEIIDIISTSREKTCSRHPEYFYDVQLAKVVGILVAGTQARIKCIYEGEKARSSGDTTMYTIGILVDDLGTPVSVDFEDQGGSLHTGNPYFDGQLRIEPVDGVLDFARGPSMEDPNRVHIPTRKGEQFIGGAEQRRYDYIMTMAKGALQRAIDLSSTDR